ncbi:Uncharacterised protein [Actinobaculum suis]|uniref:Uncharacterized protein n=1 Tax=Actinobaculum suis TaxID=1657 RepID=A0A7Z8YAJ3_9ACTO|nr:Uncharacterised protein [Actinobaculum suis]
MQPCYDGPRKANRIQQPININTHRRVLDTRVTQGGYLIPLSKTSAGGEVEKRKSGFKLSVTYSCWSNTKRVEVVHYGTRWGA